jgi:hypothetical protein
MLIKIDPIDLQIVDANIANNVDRFYFRSTTLLGPLLLLSPKASESYFIYYNRCRNRNLGTQHNLIAMSNTSNVKRFNLLPITTPSLSDHKDKSSGVDVQNTKNCTRKRPIANLQLSKSNGGKGNSQNDLKSGLVNAITGGISSAAQADSNASALLFNASSFISGIWTSSSQPTSSSMPKTSKSSSTPTMPRK